MENDRDKILPQETRKIESKQYNITPIATRENKEQNPHFVEEKK